MATVSNSTSTSTSSTNSSISSSRSAAPDERKVADERPRVELKAQLIKRKYVDRKKLVQKLTSRYGQNGFKVKLRLNRYTIMVPEPLTEGEINEFCLFR